MKFQDWSQQYREMIDAHLAMLVDGLSPALRGPSRSAVLLGGKRLRPLLSAAICIDNGQYSEDFVPLFASLEVIHSSTLIHDDLPALDNAFERRGHPANHIEWGESTAILTGDLLLGLAFQSFSRTELSADIKARGSAALSRAIVDVCIGQKLDLEQPCPDPLEMRALKTGSLFGAACELGAIAAGVSTETSDLLFKFGQRFGVGYQLADDREDDQVDAPLEHRWLRELLGAKEIPNSGLSIQVSQALLKDYTKSLGRDFASINPLLQKLIETALAGFDGKAK